MKSKHYEEIKKVLKTPVNGKKKDPTLNDYPQHLRGPSNNRYGGHQARSLRGLKDLRSCWSGQEAFT
jgi:hypothetical protein